LIRGLDQITNFYGKNKKNGSKKENISEAEVCRLPSADQRANGK